VAGVAPTSRPLFPPKKILVIFHGFAPGERSGGAGDSLHFPGAFRGQNGEFSGNWREDMGESHGLPFTSQNGDLK
jgi:hypothetical protein